jgi:hypothetical protein
MQLLVVVLLYIAAFPFYLVRAYGHVTYQYSTRLVLYM